MQILQNMTYLHNFWSIAYNYLKYVAEIADKYNMPVNSHMSENDEEASKSNKGDKFIRNMMIKLIEKMTPDMEE